jgi:hypothetical protein
MLSPTLTTLAQQDSNRVQISILKTRDHDAVVRPISNGMAHCVIVSHLNADRPVTSSDASIIINGSEVQFGLKYWHFKGHPPSSPLVLTSAKYFHRTSNS